MSAQDHKFEIFEKKLPLGVCSPWRQLKQSRQQRLNPKYVIIHGLNPLVANCRHRTNVKNRNTTVVCKQKRAHLFNINLLCPLYQYLRIFTFRLTSCLAPKKQDFWPKINILKGSTLWIQKVPKSDFQNEFSIILIFPIFFSVKNIQFRSKFYKSMPNLSPVELTK